MEMGEMKFSETRNALTSREAKDSVKNFGRGNVFDTFAERYDKWYDKPFGRIAFKLEKKCIESLCKDLEKPLLEIGVGTGRFAGALKMEYGIDKSIGVLKFAKERGIGVVRGEGENLPFLDKSFGAVFIIITLCFVDDPLKVLKETSRIMKDDGFLILGLIPKESPWASFYIEKGKEGNVFYKNARFYSLNELKSMLKNVGFQILKVGSTVLQPPTEEPLNFKSSKKGGYKDVGFIAVKLKRR